MFLSKIMIFFTFLFVLTHCAQKESDVKFVALEQDKRKNQTQRELVAFDSDNFLIHDLDDGITVQLVLDDCVDEDAAKDFVERAIFTWMDLFQEAIDEGRVSPSEPIKREVEFVGNWSITEDFELYLKCEEGRAFFHGGLDVGVSPWIHLYIGKTEYYAAGNEFLDGKFSMSTLLHELGHAFGLGDTYILDSDGSPTSSQSKHNVSTGGSDRTVGSQPLSLMNDSYNNLKPGEDEKAGMVWLYKYYVSKEITSLDECISGYYYEEATGGCLPGEPTPTPQPKQVDPDSQEPVVETNDQDPDIETDTSTETSTIDQKPVDTSPIEIPEEVICEKPTNIPTDAYNKENPRVMEAILKCLDKELLGASFYRAVCLKAPDHEKDHCIEHALSKYVLHYMDVPNVSKIIWRRAPEIKDYYFYFSVEGTAWMQDFARTKWNMQPITGTDNNSDSSGDGTVTLNPPLMTAVTACVLNVRERPTTASSKMGRLAVGYKPTIQGRNRYYYMVDARQEVDGVFWYRIHSNDTDVSNGWVHGGYIWTSLSSQDPVFPNCN